MGLNVKMTDAAIRAENLGKQYRISGPQPRYRTLRESLVRAAIRPELTGRESTIEWK
jgi:hypothetical protein